MGFSLWLLTGLVTETAGREETKTNTPFLCAAGPQQDPFQTHFGTLSYQHSLH